MKFQSFKDQHSEVAASLVEMALLIALIAVMAIPSVSWVGEGAKERLNMVGEEITAGGVYQCGGFGEPPCP